MGHENGRLVLCTKACSELDTRFLVEKPGCPQASFATGWGPSLWALACVVKAHGACLDRPLGYGSHHGLFPLNSSG